ncbi:7138_t:CDS:2 [Acaulospora colombiana]|uniref:7138_t:CDS:1 n=1 Tax=Acaulospora colombiana TaxID=27376 RepID=A0ACA9PC64_9GLOM|nr:7138_t:CDS:2 [Acaulospora colombiana]
MRRRDLDEGRSKGSKAKEGCVMHLRLQKRRSLIDTRPLFAKDMPPYIRVPKETSRVDGFHNLDKVIKVWIEMSKLVWAEVMWLRPMGSSVERDHDIFKSPE